MAVAVRALRPTAGLNVYLTRAELEALIRYLPLGAADCVRLDSEAIVLDGLHEGIRQAVRALEAMG